MLCLYEGGRLGDESGATGASLMILGATCMPFGPDLFSILYTGTLGPVLDTIAERGDAGTIAERGDAGTIAERGDGGGCDSAKCWSNTVGCMLPGAVCHISCASELPCTGIS